MATASLIPVSEYLRTFYDPDRDYVDGEIEERCLGERPHGTVQAFFISIFRNSRRAWQVWAIAELRVQISATRFRVADVCVCRTSDPPDPIVQVAPLLCIEVLSPGQSMGRIQAVVDDYLRMGVENVWLVDPETRRAWTADGSGLHQVLEVLLIEGTQIRVPLADIWAELDELAATGK